MTDRINEKNVLDALKDLAPHAALGLQIKGLVHNLSGVAQAISMQADLLAMIFEQMREKAADITATGPSAATCDLARLIEEKSVIVERLAAKSEEMQRLLHTAAGFVFAEPGSIPVIVAKVVADELEISSADMFFKHKVKKEVAIADDLPLLTVERQALQMVLHLLIRNSIESLTASQTADPTISLRAGLDGGRIRIEVEDNGVGDPEIIDRIFDPFFTTRDGHSGIGLWLARYLVERNRGKLTCERLGKGALFALEFDAGGRS